MLESFRSRRLAPMSEVRLANVSRSEHTRLEAGCAMRTVSRRRVCEC
jgi:hypothetical protein